MCGDIVREGSVWGYSERGECGDIVREGLVSLL